MSSSSYVEDSDGSGVSDVAVAAGVAGGVLVIAIVCCIAAFAWHRSKKIE